jgi:hypothetical protein
LNNASPKILVRDPIGQRSLESVDAGLPMQRRSGA